MMQLGYRMRIRKFVRDIWRDYREEGVFFLVLAGLVVLGHILSKQIPAEFFDSVLCPILNACTMSVCIVSAILLFRHSGGLSVRKAWAWTMLLWGLVDLTLLLMDVVWNQPVFYVGTDALNSLSLLVGNFLGWLMLLYPTEALRPGWMNVRRAAMQILPMAALVGLDYLVPWNLAPIVALYPVLLAAYLISHIRAYRQWCEENYSSMDNIDAQWIARYLIMLLVMGLSYFYLAVSHNPARNFTQLILMLFMFVYSTDQILFRREPWEGMENGRKEEEESPDNPESIESPVGLENAASPENAAYRAKLEEWMNTEKPYLNPDLRLMDLRAVLPLNRTYLSQLIHSEFDCTFYQYVNSYRLEEAKRLMRENPEMRVDDVASRSGFSSREVFTRVFSKETGMTPREWSKNV